MQPLGILFGARFSYAVTLALGRLLLGDACRDPGVRLVSGAAVLSLLVCALCGAGLAYPLAFLAIGFLAIGGAVLAGGTVGRTPGPGVPTGDDAPVGLRPTGEADFAGQKRGPGEP